MLFFDLFKSIFKSLTFFVFLSLQLLESSSIFKHSLGVLISSSFHSILLFVKKLSLIAFIAFFSSVNILL